MKLTVLRFLRQSIFQQSTFAITLLSPLSACCTYPFLSPILQTSICTVSAPPQIFAAPSFVPHRCTPPLLTLQDNTLIKPANLLKHAMALSSLQRTLQEEACCVVWVTVSSEMEGKKIASALLSEKAAACVNIIPGLTSVYEWEGSIEISQESLLMIKTRASLFDTVKKLVLQNHSYECPEIISTDLTNGHKDYLQWILDSTKKLQESST